MRSLANAVKVLQACNYKSDFIITCSYKCFHIQYAFGCFQFLIQCILAVKSSISIMKMAILVTTSGSKSSYILVSIGL